MPTLQIEDMPQDVYEALVERADMEHRTVEEQLIADLAYLAQENEARRQRHEAIEWLRRAGPAVKGSKLDPVALIREDRDR
jgi:hypothetical protein